MQEKDLDRSIILNFQTEYCELASNINTCPNGEYCMKAHADN